MLSAHMLVCGDMCGVHVVSTFQSIPAYADVYSVTLSVGLYTHGQPVKCPIGSSYEVCTFSPSTPSPI